MLVDVHCHFGFWVSFECIVFMRVGWYEGVDGQPLFVPNKRIYGKPQFPPDTPHFITIMVVTNLNRHQKNISSLSLT